MAIKRVVSTFISLTVLFTIHSFDTSARSHANPLHEQIDQANNNNLEEEIFLLVNKHRQAMGLTALKLSKVESTEALKHSRDMASGKVPFSHDGFRKRIQTISGQMGAISASGENVAYGIMSAKEVLDTWLQSPPHRKNIEGNYLYTGIGTAKDKDGVVYFTEIFTR